MIKLIGVLCGGYLSFLLITEGEIYAGMLVLIPIYVFAMKLASTSIYGDFTKTAKGIKSIVEKRNNPAAYNSKLTEKEKLAQRAEYRRQGTQFVERGRLGHLSRPKYKKHQQTAVVAVTLSSCSDEIITTSPLFDIPIDSGDYAINDTVKILPEPLDNLLVNPTTGNFMIGGIGGIDSGGKFFGQSDIEDTFSNDSFSSFDDSLISCSESFDSFGCDDMGDW